MFPMSVNGMKWRIVATATVAVSCNDLLHLYTVRYRNTPVNCHLKRFCDILYL